MATQNSALANPEVIVSRNRVTEFHSLKGKTICNLFVMVSRRWDTETPDENYMSTEYLLSDDKGNIVQCTALPKFTPLSLLYLKEGNVYQLNSVLVIENKDNYRVCRDNNHALIFLPDTTVSKLETDIEGFIRHPFEFVPFEDIKYVHNKYLIDVIGKILPVGKPRETPGASTYLNCKLVNARGTVLDITLWGRFCTDFLAAQVNTPGNTPIIFAAMTIEELNGHIYLSATMDTRIYTAADIQTCSKLNDELATLKPCED